MRMKKAVAMITAATSVIVGMGSVSAFAIDQDFMEAFNRRVQYPSRSEKEQQCDVVAFGLAADCNQDNAVNILDAIMLNKYLAGNAQL